MSINTTTLTINILDDLAVEDVLFDLFGDGGSSDVYNRLLEDGGNRLLEGGGFRLLE
jgi:hypothetical protein